MEVVTGGAFPFEVLDDVVVGVPDEDGGAPALAPPPEEEGAVPMVMAAAVACGEGGED